MYFSTDFYPRLCILRIKAYEACSISNFATFLYKNNTRTQNISRNPLLMNYVPAVVQRVELQSANIYSKNVDRTLADFRDVLYWK
jgi:hypothetical protein